MMEPNHQDGQSLEQQPFVSHLLELRDRLLRIVIATVAIFLILFPFANDLYTLLAGPLISQLPEGTGMIATRVIAPFLTPLKMAFVMSVFLAIPFILYQFWAFVAPGLYRHEKRLAIPLVVSSALLFYLGMAFAYFVVFPLLFNILPSMAPEEITVAPDITDYLDFVLTLFFAFGIAFEVPIATIILVWMGITTPEALAGKRPYIIVGAFLIGMLLTPPDVISQTLLAFPMWILFEFGVLFSRAFVRDRESGEEEQSPKTPQGGGGEDGSPPPEPDQPGAAPVFDGNPEPDRSEEQGAVDARVTPLTEEELDAELDLIEEESGENGGAADEGQTAREKIDAKLEKVGDCREREDEDGARALLHEVLAEGDEGQIRVARNILQQLDADY